jgi:DNA primase
MCWQHHIDADAAQDVFLDSIEKLLNKFVEQRTEVLLQKARLGQMTLREKQELQALLNA